MSFQECTGVHGSFQERTGVYIDASGLSGGRIVRFIRFWSKVWVSNAKGLVRRPRFINVGRSRGKMQNKGLILASAKSVWF